MAGDRELPPLRVKLYGDNSQYKEMLKDSEAATNAYKDQVNKATKKVKVGAPDAEFERIFHNYRLLEKSKEILDATSRKLAKREEDRVFKQEALSAKIAAIEETKAFALAAIYEKMEEMKRKAARKSARAEENRLFTQVQLQEKMLQAEEARVFTQMQLQEKLDAKKRKAAKREEDRLFAQAQLQEKMAKLEEDRLFTLAALYEKIEARKRKAMAKTAAAEEARVFSNMLLHEKAAKATEDRQFRNMQIQERAAKLEEDRQFSNYQLLEKSKAIMAKRREELTKEAHANYANEFLNPGDVAASLDGLNKIAKTQIDTEKKVAEEASKSAKKEVERVSKSVAGYRKQQDDFLNTLTVMANNADKKVEASTKQQLKTATDAHNKKLAQIKKEQQEAEKAAKAKAKTASKYNQFGGLGDRADIYMHANAIRTLIQMSSSFVAASADWQRMEVQLETLTGSAAEATRMMERFRKDALESPYDMQGLMDSARTMLAYGASVDQAQNITKMLGDVAGGSNEKLSRLSLGMAQIISLGKLQGNELRQLTEHGFNPLRTIAERTLKPLQTMEERMRELNEAKEKGRITSEMVVKALEIETAKGGRFAGMAYRMSQDIWGLTQQIQELIKFIQKRFMDTLTKDIERALRTVIQFLKRMDGWTQTNKEMVATIARTVGIVIASAVAFNMAGFALAAMRWQARMAISVYGSLTVAMAGLTKGVAMLRAGMVALNLSNPLGWAILAVGAIGGLILGVYKLNDVTGALNGTLKWLGENWAKMFGTALSMSFRLITVFFAWLSLYLPVQAYNAAVHMMNSFHKAVAQGLQSIGDMFQYFWENLYDPAKLLEYFTKTISSDILLTADKGLMAGINKVISEELAVYKTKTNAVDNAKAPDLPDAPNVDFNAMMGPGKAKGSQGPVSPVQGVLKGSQEAAVLMHQFQMGRVGRRAGGDPALEQNKKQTEILTRIEQNTRDLSSDKSPDWSANFIGPQVP